MKKNPAFSSNGFLYLCVIATVYTYVGTRHGNMDILLSYICEQYEHNMTKIVMNHMHVISRWKIRLKLALETQKCH